MVDQEILKGVIGIVAAALVTPLSIPALKQAASKLGHRGGYAEVEDLYSDKDGSATEDSTRRYTDLRPRIALWLSLSVGLATAIAAKVLLAKNGYPWADPHYRDFAVACAWLDLASWILVCVQGVCLPLKTRYLLKFRLAALGLMSSLTVAISIALRDAFPAMGALTDPDAEVRISGILCLVQLAAALAAACSFAAFPRRPDVYEDGCLVDQQNTLSLLSLFSYSWNRIVFEIPKERQLAPADIPALDWRTRSRNLQADFLARCGGGQLWRQLIRAYLSQLVIQWTLTLIIAFLALFPQVVLYNFLERIETRKDYSTTDPALLAWVFGLLLSQLLYVGVYNWLRWITNSRLDTPVLSLLQSLVFFKALKQYETAAPGQKKEEKKKGDDDAAAPNVEGGKDKKKPKEDPTRQSVINHMKLDSNRVTIFCQYNNNFPQSIFKLILAGGFLIQLLGWKATLAGLGSACMVAPISAKMSNKYGKLHFSLMSYRDNKAHLLTEALQGMRQIKYSALEQHWEDKILASRNEELKQYWRVAMWQCALIFLVNLGPLLLACVSFSVYVWENGSHIRASVLFTSLGLFDHLDEAVAFLPILQMYMVEAWTSCVRLEKYLTQADKDDVASPGETVALENATVSWPKIEDADKDSSEPRDAHSMLKDISLEFPSEKLGVITGKTGSGKSLLLAAILGEVKLLSGTIRVPTPPLVPEDTPESIPPSEWVIPSLTSFVSQTPWIESGTVKENIVFGLPFDEIRYQKVLYACALQRDVELLVDGDQTEVGPKGVTLSGGQRWRVALARAIYSRAGIIILDDVLSAVDAHVGRLIVDEALTGELAKGRTRILATHHAELVLPRASYLVRLQDGRLESAESIEPSSDDLRDLIEPASGQESETEVNSDAEADGKPLGEAQSLKQKNKKPKDSDEEKREIGRVKWKVYKAYYDASGAAVYWLFGISVLIIARLLPVARTWALKELADRVSVEALTSGPSTLGRIVTSQIYFGKAEPLAAEESDPQIAFWMGMYVLLYFLGSVVTVVRVLTLLVVGLRAARTLFQRLTHSILRAPLRWTDTVPSGRILNRFTSDTFTVDKRLAPEIFSVIQNVFGLLIIIGTSLSVSVYVLVFGLLLLILYARIASEYINAAREIKRINSTSHSPIYDQFSSVLSGLSTVRAFGRSAFYMNRMYGLIDENAKAGWALQIATRWMSFRMGALGAVFVTVVASAVAIGGVNAALAGFSLTFALRYTGALTTLLQSMTSVELGYNAAERILEYAEIETEPEGGADAPAAWPSEGRVEVDNLTVKYAEDLPEVLKNVSFTIEAGERIGVVGRTGAGKSTLAAVLFRLLEPTQGSVRVDNIDISTLKLTQLRGRLAIIPQDPFLFSGTLRSNLDMEGKLDDYELQMALQRVHLVEPQAADPERPSIYAPADPSGESSAETATPLPDPAEIAQPSETTLDDANETTALLDGAPADPASNANTPKNTNIFTNLSHPISTGGLNLSQGQRQLCCLARALLSRPKIVVLDEATSAVDRGTDASIQASLRREFAAAGCTVLVVAHRLSTVADFDRLLVMEGGRVAEMGTPKELLLAGMEKDAAASRAGGVGDDGDDAGSSSGGSGSGTVGAEGEDGGDGTGAFWGLVQKSAEKEKLIELILGEKREESGSGV